ncbi:MAG: hypothetical protein KF726_26125 [Anaerolineae bacterium]|nr:hypothetical protein [Anaerolineae bacterium]
MSGKSAFVWKLPGDPLDQDRIDRMKRHFLKPLEPMPYAWFMGLTIDFFTDIAKVSPEALTTQMMMRPLAELGAGLTYFHDVEQYVPIWKAWFLYLLPNALSAPRTDIFDGFLTRDLFSACLAVYPQQIIDEYSSFRDDLVYTLGTRSLSLVLARDNLRFRKHLHNPLFSDMWYFVESEGKETPSSFGEFCLPMLFCLKYLYPSEIPDWVKSLLEIDSPQWRLAVITWWLAFQLVREPLNERAEKGNPQAWIESICADMKFRLEDFASFDEIVPPQNIHVFKKVVSQYLTIDVFNLWAADIRSHRTWVIEGNSYPVDAVTLAKVEQSLQEFENKFFS